MLHSLFTKGAPLQSPSVWRGKVIKSDIETFVLSLPCAMVGIGITHVLQSQVDTGGTDYFLLCLYDYKQGPLHG